ncbi:MAG: tetratricopeptide repeat protein [Elusimicrobiota bacterium]
MAKAWARKEAKKNEFAALVEKGVLWVKYHPTTSMWGGIGVIAVALVAASFYNRMVTQREESWSRYAVAQSYAYSRQPDAALEQIRLLTEEFPTSAASSYALLLAGDILYERGSYKEAAASYDKIVVQPNHAEAVPIALTNLSLSQEAAGNCKSASDSAQRLLDSYGEHFLAPQAHASLARCLVIAGEREKARATFEKMAVLYPNTYWAQWAQARLQG